MPLAMLPLPKVSSIAKSSRALVSLQIAVLCVEEIACKTFKESYENNDDVHAIRLDR